MRLGTGGAVLLIAACAGRSLERGGDGSGESGGSGGSGGSNQAGRGSEPVGGRAGAAGTFGGGAAGTFGGGTAGTFGGGTAGAAARGGTAGVPIGGAPGAGRGGTGGEGSVGGVGAFTCECPDLESANCEGPVEALCGPIPDWGCALTYDELADKISRECPPDSTLGTVWSCGETIGVEWMEGYENNYGLYFDAATGELVAGYARGYVGMPPCAPDPSDAHYRAGVEPDPESCTKTCRFCEPDLGIGGEGGAPSDGVPRCSDGIRP